MYGAIKGAIGQENDESTRYQDLTGHFAYADEMKSEEGALPRRRSRPRFVLAGLRHSGKTSIQKIVFSNMSPSETLFLDPTEKLVKNNVDNSLFTQFQIWDFPGDTDFSDPNLDSKSIFESCDSLIYVIDAQDNYINALPPLVAIILRSAHFNPALRFEVFIHKVDSLSADRQIEVQCEIQQCVFEELSESKLENVNVTFYLTSIYDYSIFEAFSKVVQKSIPQLPTLENLLDILSASCQMEKVFLIDTMSKIYIATDSNPVDMQTLELCSDMIDVVLNLSSIYSGKEESEANPLSSQESKTLSVIHLDNDMLLYLRETQRCLALVCLFRQDRFIKPGIIEYNFRTFKTSLFQVFRVQFESVSGKQEFARRSDD
ncbi:uncharacterized protein LOC126326540 [Schistocerca gregaria]|uniref:uncharacterized protein LOC126326540 n=1 Tax=Schistocerca gregaria TaxID=7010 RepID=UPI00211DDD22|nr:uncharacterized protein LOC126326540 [Schistocerca gregaria]